MAKAIMIQGTMSNAGKSLLVAGLCRILMQDGYRVAPFKSQNMALNSYITADGLEMGRAQVMQAEAAGILPSVHMNPILLKPTTDMGSQVIVNGSSVGNMDAREYFACKKDLLPVIQNAYHALEQEYDIIVIEGAGSPAEINLKQDDIVNMGMAKLADAPVLLVGDIDRGGVFAQLYGTTQLLMPEEKRRIKALIINKFRGDPSLLVPGIKQIEALCHIPVAGVMPYMKIDIDDEDSLGEHLSRRLPTVHESDIEIAVIRFPRLSNFTDFSVFSCIPSVKLTYVSQVSELKTPDLIILPGTKNTIADLLWMRENGLEKAVMDQAEQGIPIWGICGGYQMMGEVLEDPNGVEGTLRSSVRGMGLLPTKTVFSAEKTRTQVEGAFSQVEGIFEELSGKSFWGYEIHMGQTWIDRENGPADTARLFCGKLEICRPLSYLLPLASPSKKMLEDGWSRGNIYGCYTHGIFDQAEIVKTLINALRNKKNLSPLALEGFDFHLYKEKQYNQLADTMRQHLDIQQIYQILGLETKNTKKRAESEKTEETGKTEKMQETEEAEKTQETKKTEKTQETKETEKTQETKKTKKTQENEETENIREPGKEKIPVFENIPPAEIESRSFALISGELQKRKITLVPGTEPIVKRAIHTTADFDYAENLVFSPGAVEKALQALNHGAVIITDTNMAKAGINQRKASANGNKVYCFMSDKDVAQAAKDKGCTRAAASMEKAVGLFGHLTAQPLIFAIGNAPTALHRLYSLIEEGKLSPALIIGVPVGFVNVIPSKVLMMEQSAVPYIIARGRKGGSNVAAAIVNALLYLIN